MNALLIAALLATVPPAEQFDAPEKCVDLPPGVFFPAPTYAALNQEITRLQDQETRLTAQNDILREQLAEKHSSNDTRMVIVTTVISAVVAGGAVFILTR